MQIGDDFRQHMDRIDRSAAEQTGMKVAIRSLDDDFLRHDSTQHGGDGRRGAIKHAGIADQRDVGAEVIPILREEGGQRVRTRFLFTLKENGDVAREIAGFFQRPAGLDKGH